MDDNTVLSQTSVFESLPLRDAHRLVELATRKSFVEGEHIIRKGAVGDSMYVVLNGRVRVPQLDPSGSPRPAVHLGAGEVFGEMALLTDLPRNADVIAETETCDCLVLEREAVNDLMQKHPSVSRFLTEILGERLMASDQMRNVGKYRLVRHLGAGGMATVYEGYHPALDRQVAIKMLPHQLLYEGDFLDRFKREAKVIANLHHPNIVEVYDTEQAYATYFIVMELLSGRDLGDLLEETGPLPFDAVREIIRQTAAALAHAHDRGIVHSDIKPSNIIVGEGHRAKLVDFGIARRVSTSDMEESEAGFAGTPIYAPPELFSGSGIDARSDIYSLGITAFHMLTGAPPFPGPAPMQLMMQHMMEPLPDITERRSGVPEDLVDFVNASTGKKPEDRLQDCASILSLLAPPCSPLDDGDD